MANVDQRNASMPRTLGIALIILGLVTLSSGCALLPLALFMGAWGGWIGLVPLVLWLAYATATFLVLLGKSWARFATPLFPVSFTTAAVALITWEGVPLALFAAAAFTLTAVVLIFSPPSRAYFVPEASIPPGR